VGLILPLPSLFNSAQWDGDGANTEHFWEPLKFSCTSLPCFLASRTWGHLLPQKKCQTL